MTRQLEMLGILLQIALRNLFASRLKTLIVGGILFFGALLVVVGTSMLDTITEGMAKSIIGSTAGHLQTFNAKSKDDLALYGGMTGDVDLRPIEDFSAVKQSLLSVPEVKAAVPMGIAEAMVGSGNDFDRALERLRGLAKRRQSGEKSTELEAQYAAVKDQVQVMIALLRKDLAAASVMLDETAADREAAQDRDRAASEAFWAGFDKAPFDALEFLENKIAPQSIDGDWLWVRYIGTDLDAYQQAFDRFHVVQGTPVPKGQRGMLLGSLYMEDWIKLKTARRLDKLAEAVTQAGRSIAKDEELKRFVKENQSQVREVLVQLDSIKTRTLVARLQKSLGSQETDPGKLLAALLDTNDSNIAERRAAFYDQVVPLVDLYRVRVGDSITIKAFTKAGYMKSVNVKIYGIAEFKGLEKSSFASTMSLMDLMTFRDLYGYLTADRAAEIRKLKEASGAREIKREDAEAALFGDGAQVVAQVDTKPQGINEAVDLDPASRLDLSGRVYSQDEIDKGVALNVAIILKDPTRIHEAIPVVQAALKRDGLDMKVFDWEQAAGMLGQFIRTMTYGLLGAVLIIFCIALVIINNAMVMATLQRVKEIGTLRALGAQRRFVLTMIAVETLALGLLFGALGGGAGAGLIAFLRSHPIPATSDYAYFFYSGPQLIPHLTTANLGLAFAIVIVVSLLAAMYPAFIATRITPVQAMASEE